MEFNYVCSQCARTYPIEAHIMVCPECARHQAENQPLQGVLEVDLHGSVGADFDIPRLLPVEEKYFPPIPVGNTPLWRPDNLRKALGLNNLYIKDDGVNPTFSLKDRASFLVSAFAARSGINEIVLASTGNAGSSMAGVGAAAGQKVTLFLPMTAPEAKLVQALQYGAFVHRVDGTYDDAYELSAAYTEKFGGMSRNTAYNPMTLEGKKTVALEIFKQLGKAPDRLLVATGDGCILSGIYKGFRDLLKLGLIQTIPAIVSVQAQGSDALYRAWQSHTFAAVPAHTLADSICVDVPRNGLHALKQLQAHGGRVITVTDEQIIQTQARLSRTTGLFAEPAGAAAMAGLLKLAPEIDAQETVVVLTTGNGLKDTSAAIQGIEVPEAVIKSLDDIE